SARSIPTFRPPRRFPMPNEEAKPAAPAPATKPAVDPRPAPSGKSRKFKIIGAVVAALLLVIAIPRIIHAFGTVSTDDAYVNSYATFVAPRVAGQVLRVLVDDNNRVRKGDLLVELDPEPFQVQVSIKQAAVDSAKANMMVAEATVRGLIGQARSQRFKLSRAI